MWALLVLVVFAVAGGLYWRFKKRGLREAAQAPAGLEACPACAGGRGSGQMTLVRAAAEGDLAAVEELLGGGADVNTRGRGNITALMEASVKGHAAVARLLLDKGADVNAQSNDGWTALFEAALSGHTDIAKMLVDAGADVNLRAKDGMTALMEAAFKGRSEIVELLAERGADLNAEACGMTALTWALSDQSKGLGKTVLLREREKIAKFLRGRGAR